MAPPLTFVFVTSTPSKMLVASSRSRFYLSLRTFSWHVEIVCSQRTNSGKLLFLQEKDCDICGVEITDDAKPVNQHPFKKSTAFLLGNEVFAYHFIEVLYDVMQMLFVDNSSFVSLIVLYLFLVLFFIIPHESASFHNIL